MVMGLKSANGRRKVEGSTPSPKGRPVAPVDRKVLSAKEKRTPAGKFAIRLQSLLDERGWTVPQLEERSGIAGPTLRRWLRAEGFPKVVEMPRLGEALNTPSHPFPDWRMILPADL